MFCQNSTALFTSPATPSHRKSQILGDFTSELSCSQNETEQFDLSYVPFDIIPCSLGYLPVSRLACTVDVTAGKTGVTGQYAPRSAICWILGRFSVKILDDSKPTTLKTTKCFFKLPTNIEGSIFKECSKRRVSLKSLINAR